MLLWISKEAIACGKRLDSSECPIANAIAPLLRAGYRVRVGVSLLHVIRISSPVASISLDEIAIQFRANFDNGKKVQPTHIYLPGLENYCYSNQELANKVHLLQEEQPAVKAAQLAAAV